jgi:hypothetical protein
MLQAETQNTNSMNFSLVHLWKNRLGIEDYVIITERISLFQVSDDFCRVGNSFVGIQTDHDEKIACIYHTRALREDDVVHELLHVRYPSWSEEKVNCETGRLVSKRRKRLLISL